MEKVLKMVRTISFYTHLSVHYQQKQWTKRLNHTSVVYQDVAFWPKGLMFSEENVSLDYDAHGEVNTTHLKRTILMSNPRSLPQEERVYEVKGDEPVCTI